MNAIEAADRLRRWPATWRPGGRRRGAALAGGGAVLTALALTLPYTVPRYYVTLATLVLVTALLAASVNMLAGGAGLVSLGHAGIAASAGYGVAWAAREGYGLGTQLALAAALTLLTSAIYALISMRTRGIYFLMVTLAAGMVCYGAAFRWSSVTGGDNGITGVRRPGFVAEYWQYYYLVLAVFVVATGALVVLARSPFGLVLRGIRDGEDRIRSLGYSVAGHKFAAMVLSGTVAGTAGVLAVWHSEFVSPDAAGIVRSSIALVTVVLGGLGTTLGPLVGAVVVVGIEQVLSTYVERWQLVLGVVFIACVVLTPSGIVGSLSRRRPGTRRPGAAHRSTDEPVQPS